VARDADAQGLFFKDTGHLTNTAIVNAIIDLDGSGGSALGANCQELRHFLMHNVVHSGPALRWAMPQSEISLLSIRASLFQSMVIEFSAGADGLRATDFDQNHFTDGSSLVIGTHATTGPSLCDADFRPMPGSPLLSRTPFLLTPIALGNAPRSVPGSVGAHE